MAEQVKPKPCPFCGGKAKVEKIIDRVWQCECVNERCTLHAHYKDEAIAAWNTRHEPDDVAALREQADCYTEIAEAVDKLHDDGRTVLDCVVMGMSAVEDVAKLRAVIRDVVEQKGIENSAAVQNVGDCQRGLHCGLEDVGAVAASPYIACDYGFEHGVERTMEWVQGELKAALTGKGGE